MAEREHLERSTDAEADELVDEVPAATTAGQEIKDDLDSLLDEIDEVLESNAEEFVKSYVQKGGQ